MFVVMACYALATDGPVQDSEKLKKLHNQNMYSVWGNVQKKEDLRSCCKLVWTLLAGLHMFLARACCCVFAKMIIMYSLLV